MKIIILALAMMLVFPAAAEEVREGTVPTNGYETEEECNVALSFRRSQDSSCLYGDCRLGLIDDKYYRFLECGNFFCNYDSKSHCLSKWATTHISCAQDPSTGCYYPAGCRSEYYEYDTTEFVNVTVPVSFCGKCPQNATCDGKDVFCDSGYTLTTVQEGSFPLKDCVLSTEENNKIDNVKQTEAFASIEGECPDGLRKSSDGCCCIK